MNTRKKPKRWLAIIAILGLLLLAALTVAFLLLSSSNRNSINPFYARDIADASYDCENKIDRRFKDDLINKSFDNFSSRYEPNKRQYVIYYRLSVSVDEGDYMVTQDLMAKCIVWERLGYVSDFQIFEP